MLHFRIELAKFSLGYKRRNKVDSIFLTFKALTFKTSTFKALIFETLIFETLIFKLLNLTPPY